MDQLCPDLQPVPGGGAGAPRRAAATPMALTESAEHQAVE